MTTCADLATDPSLAAHAGASAPRVAFRCVGTTTPADTIALLRTLVGFDTTSRHSNLTLVDWVVAYLESHGGRVRLTHSDAGDKANLLASFGPAVPGGVVLSAHTDVVPAERADWQSDPFVLTERDGRLCGRGVADMEGFIAACLAAVPSWSRAKLRRPIHLALSYDEEVGCLGVPRLLDDLVAHVPMPALAIVGEPTEWRVGVAHRGFFGYRTRFQGRAAHSSDPAAGISAIAPAADFVRFLLAQQKVQAPAPATTTFNIGRIEGGTAINTVPDRCEVIWEFRPGMMADVGTIRAKVGAFLATAIPPEVRTQQVELAGVPPLAAGPAQPAARLACACGGIGPAIALGFGTEAGFFQNAGIPAVVCGPGSITQAHHVDEWIARDQLTAADDFLRRLVMWAQAEDAARLP